MRKIMLFTLAAMLGIAVANAQDPCNVPVNVEVSGVTANGARVSWSGGDAPEADGFPGEWNMAFSDGDELHMTVTLSPTLHMMLQMQGSDMDDIDTTTSAAGIPVFVTIEQGSGDQYTVSGSFDMEFGSFMDAIPFHFNTTGTLDANGLSIEPATISETVNLMGQLPLEFTGTVTFAQPTALPTDGVLTIVMSSLALNGTGNFIGTDDIVVTLNGEDLHAVGTLAIPGVEGYEIRLNDLVMGQTNTYSTTYTHYAFYDLESETDYTVAVRTLCSGSTYSDWSDAVPFTTLEGSDYSEYCDAPTGLAVEQSVEDGQLYANITWEGTSDDYDIEIRTEGQAQPYREMISYNGYGLNEEPTTTYTVRVRSRCAGGFTSVWTEAITFTSPAAPQPQGIADVNAKSEVSIYPNPANSRTIVSVEGMSGKAQLSVVDMSGRTVMTTTMSDGTVELNVAKLAKGTYFVRINSDEMAIVRKLIVK
ncbi:MAG: T9SS type A sorting domain-containing protein [Bacteroidales bacterium]|nr:T9SS type A sorting domain-containing protein [Bacteroidales bacterium]